MDATPHDTTVQEARMARRELERAIGKLLAQFSADTGLRVTDVALTIVEMMPGHTLEGHHIYDVEISANL